MHEALTKAGKDSTLVEIEKGEHWLENQAARTTWLTALEAFLAKHIGT
jgi:dipeptidyl aminopeptidase/acylaminoacyl peptidase